MSLETIRATLPIASIQRQSQRRLYKHPSHLVRAGKQKLDGERGLAATRRTHKKTHPVTWKPAPQNAVELSNSRTGPSPAGFS